MQNINHISSSEAKTTTPPQNNNNNNNNHSVLPLSINSVSSSFIHFSFIHSSTTLTFLPPSFPFTLVRQPSNQPCPTADWQDRARRRTPLETPQGQQDIPSDAFPTHSSCNGRQIAISRRCGRQITVSRMPHTPRRSATRLRLVPMTLVHLLPML